ncbi:unnamed protein product [Mytilus coruscus]|uniref:Uncharacterized protein n=1 Tax=Mytilus coruscus TaxID=42192 RepID=A0A6J8A9B1_MYTCO|nr:unnamed protein product [Mytilus coruscus]
MHYQENIKNKHSEDDDVKEDSRDRRDVHDEEAKDDKSDNDDIELEKKTETDRWGRMHKKKCTDDDRDHCYILTPDSANYKMFKHTPTLLFINEDRLIVKEEGTEDTDLDEPEDPADEISFADLVQQLRSKDPSVQITETDDVDDNLATESAFDCDWETDLISEFTGDPLIESHDDVQTEMSSCIC